MGNLYIRRQILCPTDFQLQSGRCPATWKQPCIAAATCQMARDIDTIAISNGGDCQ